MDYRDKTDRTGDDGPHGELWRRMVARSFDPAEWYEEGDPPERVLADEWPTNQLPSSVPGAGP